MSDNTILGTKPFSDYMSVAEAALKVMQPIDEQGIEEGNGKGEHDPTDSLEVGSHPDWPEGKKKKKKVTEKRGVAFARKFYQKGDK